MIRFDYLEPATLAEASSLLKKYGAEARVLAGGTDLLPRLKQRAINARFLINIKRIPGLEGISFVRGEGLKIGSLTTIREMEKSALLCRDYHPLWEAARVLGSVQVRNLATLGGNLCHAAPSAETTAPLLALEALACIAGPRGERKMPLQDFFLAPGKTALERDEILKEVIIPPPPPNTGGTYFKLSPRRAMDIAIVGVAAVVTLEGDICRRCRIALGAVAPTPIRATKAEAVLEGKRLEPGLLEEVGKQAMREAKPITDHRGSAEYRSEMVKTLTIRAVREAAHQASSNI